MHSPSLQTSPSVHSLSSSQVEFDSGTASHAPSAEHVPSQQSGELTPAGAQALPAGRSALRHSPLLQNANWHASNSSVPSQSSSLSQSGSPVSVVPPSSVPTSSVPPSSVPMSSSPVSSVPPRSVPGSPGSAAHSPVSGSQVRPSEQVTAVKLSVSTSGVQIMHRSPGCSWLGA